MPHMNDGDESQLRDLSRALDSICSRASVRFDGQTPLLFAIARDNSYSIDLRRKGDGLVIEFWLGYPNDKLVCDQRADSFAASLAECKLWLLKGAALTQARSSA